MTLRIVIAGTDTDVGKTIFSAGLIHALDGAYWKPVQSGSEPEVDRVTVARLSGIPSERILPEAYCFTNPVSPHLAADLDGIAIDPARLTPPQIDRPLVIELAGGLLVPITKSVLQIDLVAQWKAPVILVSSTRLGTINHTLLSIEALKRRAITTLGVAFMGADNSDSRRAIERFGGVRDLGCMPHIETLTPTSLHSMFARQFRLTDMLGLGAAGP
jgi:dethiobiotin synthetase